jgi:pyrimidine-specific ribonucleoside hydrolase
VSTAPAAIEVAEGVDSAAAVEFLVSRLVAYGDGAATPAGV